MIGPNYFPMSTVIFTKMQNYLVGDIPTSQQLVEEWECDVHNIVHPARWHARCNPTPPVPPRAHFAIHPGPGSPVFLSNEHKHAWRERARC